MPLSRQSRRLLDIRRAAAKAAYQAEEIEAHEIGNVRVLHMLDEVASEIEQSLLLILDHYTIASLMEDILPTSPRS